MSSSPFLEDAESTWGGSAGESHAGSRGLRPGLAASGRYRIGALLGAGGMGLVYEAEHLLLGVPVALKVLRPELIEREGMVERFRDEARCTATLGGPHVVRVLDGGRLETGLPFFVMERLQGLDLRTLLQSCGRLPSELVVAYALQTCSALARAHAAHIIHRDIKPSNLFVTSHASGQSQIKLLDFGIARLEAPDRDEAEPLGTASYASPEQIATPKRVDERSDIWALGVVMFEALTGSLPFVTGWFGKRALDLRALRTRSDLPEGLAAVVCRCLAEDMDERFASAATLARALAPFGMQREHSDAFQIYPLPLNLPRRSRRDGLAPRARASAAARMLRSQHPARGRSWQPRPVLPGSVHRV